MNTLYRLILRDIEVLFQPYVHRKITLPTRLVIAQESIPYGMRTPGLLLHYRHSAADEVGLILTPPVLIDDPAAGADWRTPLFYGGRALRLWKQIVQTVHTTACKIAPQLHHAGMCRPMRGDIPHPKEAPVGPSGICPFTLEQTGEELSPARMAQVADAYARAAAAARDLRFDAIEINGSAGSLLDQFFRPETNRRTDIYGASAVARTRFATEVVHAVRKAVGKAFPIIFRYSQHGIGQCAENRLANTPEELAEFLLPLRDAGVDIFHCTGEHFAIPEFAGSGLNLAGWTRIITGKTSISTGKEAPRGNNALQKLYAMMRAGEFDLVSLNGELAKSLHTRT